MISLYAQGTCQQATPDNRKTRKRDWPDRAPGETNQPSDGEKMDAKYIHPFINAVRKLFNTMIDVPFTLGKPSLKKGNFPEYEISGFIGLSGTVTGCVVINLSKEIALQLVSALIGDEVTELDDDCTDAIGEIANIIAGNAKTDFPTAGTSISVPSVVVGKHKVSYPSGLPIVCIPCITDKGELIIEIALKENG
jgi:chemotaxis protein CheX